MMLETGIALSFGMILFLLVSIGFSLARDQHMGGMRARLDLAAAFLLCSLNALTICAFALDAAIAPRLLQWSAYGCVGYALIGNMVGLGALYRHFHPESHA